MSTREDVAKDPPCLSKFKGRPVLTILLQD